MSKSKKKNLIVDLDGTLAFEDHRRHLIKSEGWAKYFSKVHLDEPNKDLIQLLRFISDSSNMHTKKQIKIHILTGRCASARTATEEWLTEHGVDCDSLTMRNPDSPYPDFSKPLDKQKFVSDAELKTSMLEQLGLNPDNVIMVFDDRDDMVKWWRDNGYSCCQVRPQGVFFNPKTGEPG